MDSETGPAPLDNLVTTSSQDNEEEVVETVEAGQAVDDEARSEATFAFKVENFSTIKDVWSPPCIVSNLPWSIYVGQTQVYHSD